MHLIGYLVLPSHIQCALLELLLDNAKMHWSFTELFICWKDFFVKLSCLDKYTLSENDELVLKSSCFVSSVFTAAVLVSS